jgi:UDP-2-acetamido-3-amino-2,3-dideoxy-glucuronate N-acetyltransferase
MGDIADARIDPAAPEIHPTAIVEDGAVVGGGTTIWHRSHVRAGSRIGERCKIGFAVYVDTGVRIGDRCKVQNHVSLYQGVTLDDDVFVGPGATFTNDLHPRADAAAWDVVPTLVGGGASVGANATVVCGVEIGSRAMVGAGAVVTQDVPPHGLVVGTPARLWGWVCWNGHPLARVDEPIPERCARCGSGTAGIGS